MGGGAGVLHSPSSGVGVTGKGSLGVVSDGEELGCLFQSIVVGSLPSGT